MKKVVFAAQERIDDFERAAVEFFRAVLGMDYGECIVTDESRLSDFASCGLPEDIAAAVVFLASDEAAFITGQVICVDGGSLAHQPYVADFRDRA